MEKRDPFREVANTSSNNEPQEAVEDASKQPDPVAGSSSDNKENGFGRKTYKSDDKSDIGCGSNKPKETKPRRSILKSFDPLYRESPEKFKPTSSSKNYKRPRQQLVIEDSDESECTQTSQSAEVSDDDTTFVDACTATDDITSGFQLPQNQNLQLEESLLKFYTPDKVYVARKGSDSESTSTSDITENKSVLINIETSTSSNDQSPIQKQAVQSSSHPLNITESEIVSAISKKLSSECDIIPTRSKFTISESELENYNLLRERFSVENREAIFRARQENAADAIEANSLSSVSEIRNISPERSIVVLESGIRNDESVVIEDQQHSENSTIAIIETVEKEELSDDSQESKISVIETSTVVEINSEIKDNSFIDTVKEETDHTIPESEPQSSSEEPSVSKETESSESPNSPKNNIIEDVTEFIEKEKLSDETNKFQSDDTFKTSEIASEELPKAESELDKPIEEQETLQVQIDQDPRKDQESSSLQSEDQQAVKQESSELHPEENKKEPTNESHVESESQFILEDKETDKEESFKEDLSKEVCEKFQKDLGSDFESDQKPEKPHEHIASEREAEAEPDQIPEVSQTFLGSGFETKTEPDQKPEADQKLEVSQKYLESHCEAETEPDQKPEVSEKHLESDCKAESEPEQKSDESQKHLGPDCEGESDFKQTEKIQEHLESDSEAKSEETFEKPEVDEGKCLELEVPDKKVEEANIVIPEVELKKVEEANIVISEVEPQVSIDEAVPEIKTEESEDKIPQIQKSPDESNATEYIHQEEEHHIDSGLDSIEDSYTKSPKSQVGDSEDSEKGEAEDQEISPEREDSCLPDEKLDHTGDEIKTESVTEDSKTVVDGSNQDEQPQVVDEPAESKIEEEAKLVEEPIEPEADRTVINLTDNQKSEIKTTADIDSLKVKMADLSEKLNEQQQENSDLKLQLNAIQQAKASLELEIRQKEEVIIKTQAEALKNEQTYKQEIKQLREKLKENSKLIEKDGSKELEDQLKEAKAKEAKAVAELNQRTKDDLNYQKIMEEYENTIATRFADYQKLKEEHETATRHLANIELAFSDVHQKYERTKALLEGFKSNEEALNAALQASEKTCKQHEERYESLKAHAKGQIEKSNKEILMLRDKYEMDINKLKAIIKRLEIKCSSLEVSLQQKTEECAALSALCDEVTGKKV